MHVYFLMGLEPVGADGENRPPYLAAMNPACRWIETPDAAFLHWHYACIATVKGRGEHFETSIDWQDRTHVAQVATLAQGIHDVSYG
jgi:hypothetical protein